MVWYDMEWCGMMWYRIGQFWIVRYIVLKWRRLDKIEIMQHHMIRQSFIATWGPKIWLLAVYAWGYSPNKNKGKRQFLENYLNFPKKIFHVFSKYFHLFTFPLALLAKARRNHQSFTKRHDQSSAMEGPLMMSGQESSCHKHMTFANDPFSSSLLEQP